MNKLIKWDVYEIGSVHNLLHGIKLRGKIRKFCLDNEINVLVENASDIENKVRFAVLSDANVSEINKFIKTLFSDFKINLVMKDVENPVLSKLKINDTDRYKI